MVSDKVSPHHLRIPSNGTSAIRLWRMQTKGEARKRKACDEKSLRYAGALHTGGGFEENALLDPGWISFYGLDSSLDAVFSFRWIDVEWLDAVIWETPEVSLDLYAVSDHFSFANISETFHLFEL